MTPLAVGVVGDGRMGTAYASRLRRLGFGVDHRPLSAWLSPEHRFPSVLVVALWCGAQVDQLLQAMVLDRPVAILDLTTQAVDESARAASLAQAKGAAYFGGGVTGGRIQAEVGELHLLVGPPPEGFVRDVAYSLGRLSALVDAPTAMAAKLLHNLVLVVHAHVLGTAIQLAAASGVPDFPSVLASGTAGRPVHASSVVRDWAGVPSSSYSSALVAKDLRAIVSSFPLLDESPGVDLRALAEVYDTAGDVAYTFTALGLPPSCARDTD